MKRGKTFRLIVNLLLTISVVLPFAILQTAHAAAGTVTSGACSATVGDVTTASIALVTGTNDCALTFTTNNQTTSITNSWTVPANLREIQFLLVGGGGSGGSRTGGGGGAGGYVYLQNVAVRPGDSLPITVGGGGIAVTAGNHGYGGNGSNSTIGLYSAAGTATSFTAIGGGAGWTTYGAEQAGTTGGSAGGSGGAATGASATQPAQNYGNGNNGATGVTGGSPDNSWSGGGGGGAGSAGSAGDTNQNSSTGKGGSGLTNSITGSSVCYAAGGGAGVGGGTAGLLNNGGSCGSGQVGGSGSLATYAASSPVANTGSGGGSGFVSSTDGQASNGSGGILIIRWTIPGNVGAFPNVPGLVARFNAANFNNAPNMNSGLGTWADTSGSGFHVYGSNITGTAMTTSTNNGGNGATGNFATVSGTTGSNIYFLSTTQFPAKYTFFHVARYKNPYSASEMGTVGNNDRSRIFDGVTGNWLSGFWAGASGVAYHEGWLTSSSTDTFSNNWVLSADCGYDATPVTNSCSSSYWGQNAKISTTTTTDTTDHGLAVNNFGAYSGEISNFLIADMLVFNSVLNLNQMNAVTTYLQNKYGISNFIQQTPTAPTPLSSTLNNNTATVSFTGSSSTSLGPITNYEYSTDGVNYTPFSPAITSSPATINSIPTGITNLYLKGINVFGEGTASTPLQIVNGAAVGVALSTTGSNYQFQHSGTLNLVATLTGSNGNVTFYYNQKKIFHCVGIVSSGLVATCPWKPSAHGVVIITAYASPSNSSYTSNTSAPMQLFIGPRTFARG